ncbi:MULTISPECIES: GntR family transcriptional regulator [Caproicibacterium]|uniref:GntR family transcriptional regulator n=1 Tax=Caproicibacterium argilliputei TaxID=3030016 RepID=A0AA97D825_9FIRM|nr:GntR family transcriptional regulator [Caproicibacterium argilliputei]WOC31961.1 GntR family transcriptional regulator [Caproicibacterium argilliputei]
MLPKYMILVNWIRDRIKSQEFQYGEKLASEKELGQLFNVSRQTVRQAINVLVQEGLLESRQGSGTYVTRKIANTHAPQMVVGVISTYVNDYIFSGILRGMENVLTENGYSMQLAFTHNHMESEKKALSNMIARGVDGLIVEPAKSGLPSPNMDLYGEVLREGLPMLFFNTYYPSLQLPHVALDDMATGLAATEHLIRAGHRRIAGIFKLDDYQGRLRYAGYIRALMNAGIPLDDDLVLWYSTEDFADGFKTEKFQHRLQDATAVFCYNDQIALQVVATLRELGRRIPQDISIVSVDNSDLAKLCEVPLTSVAHPMEDLGMTAAQNLLRLIQDPTFNATVDFPPHLVERDSVCPPRSL